ncbi:MAG: hypothetical protein EZS28_005424 [Streblomastix strix]|uniref:Uncharacterized protein n=1 Tax=Streblomastix strix TaxID=222440 RepID=A0A5J4WW32_9EUKA|nr:MAG: hypothetical protein EZS28_005424 [Streblomastix strix]
MYFRGSTTTSCASLILRQRRDRLAPNNQPRDKPSQRSAVLTPAQITNNLLLRINTKSEYQTQQSQISQTPSQQQGTDSEGNQTQRQNTISRNSHTVMEIDMESEGRDINPPPLLAKINQASINRQRDYWATKSYLLKYIGKPCAGQHHPGRGQGRIEVQEELDTDLKLDTVGLQSPISDSEEQGKEKDQSIAFWNNPRKSYRQDDRSNSRGNNQNFQLRYNTRDDFRSQGRGQRGGGIDCRGRGYRGNRGGRNRDG